ncbi:Vacuolar protein sorting-associated protein 37A [Rhizophlyctis rosea]|nr:Vacuolar protein sorting-associated protein 37A [Rhizophlyctis rosea]
MFGGKRSTEPKQWGTPLQELRRKQIASLSSHNLNVREVQPETQYEVTIHLPSLTLFLIVDLPPHFPDSAPTIQVKPLLRHPWLDPQGYVIGHDKLANWNQHVSLGKLVKEISQEFTIRPPLRPANNYSTYETGTTGPPYSPNPTSNRGLSAAGASGLPYRSPQSSPAPAASSAWADYPDIDSKSAEELEELLNDEIAFQIYLENLSSIKGMKQVHKELMDGNESLARRNLSKKEELESLKKTLSEQQQLFQSLRAKFDTNLKAQQDEAVRFSPTYVATKLQSAQSESDELSESIAQSFLDGKIPADDFIKQYRDTRRVYHLRAAKLERLARDPQVFHGVG